MNASLSVQPFTLACCLQDYVAPGCGFYKVHDKLSDVTDKRKKCMPFEGTLDFWVLLAITLLNVFVFVYGFITLGQQETIISLRGSEQQNVKLIALIFALVEATPGILFLWCDDLKMQIMLPAANDPVHTVAEVCGSNIYMCVTRTLRDALLLPGK